MSAHTSNRNTAFIVFFSAGLIITIAIGVLYFSLILRGAGNVTIGNAVAVVDIVGPIYYDRAKVDEILGYGDDDNIKAVVLYINSPGGGVAASQALYHAVMEVRDAKPVVAAMASVAASGGYYVACAADTIFAEEGTLTGSIGVIAQFLHTNQLYQKIGLDVSVITAGKYKDVGSPHRPMTEEERAYLGRLLDSTYEQFLRAVSDGRGMPLEDVRPLAEGRIYSGEQAMEAGLVDRMGSYQDAVDLAGRMGGIDGHPKVVRRHQRRSLLDRLLGISPEEIRQSRYERVSLKYIIP